MIMKISDMLSEFCYFGDKVKVAITIIQQFYLKNHNCHQFCSQPVFHSGLSHENIWTLEMPQTKSLI